MVESDGDEIHLSDESGQCGAIVCGGLPRGSSHGVSWLRNRHSLPAFLIHSVVLYTSLILAALPEWRVALFVVALLRGSSHGV